MAPNGITTTKIRRTGRWMNEWGEFTCFAAGDDGIVCEGQPAQRIRVDAL
jgi:hypothetical protein